MYKYLLFDADDTLFDFLKAEKTALKLAMEDCGIAFKDEYVPMYSEMNVKMWQQLERKEITKPELIATRFSNFYKLAGIEGDAEPMRIAYQKRLGEQAFLLPGSYEMLERLSKEYEIYVITNGLKATQTGRFNRTDITRFIKGIFISEEVGFEKPDRAYFDYIESKIPGFKKEEAIIIGDSLTSDILGGNNAGIATVWFNAKNKTNNTKAVPDYTISDIWELIGILGE